MKYLPSAFFFAAFPLAALAQAPGGQPPAAETNQNNAHGGINDMRPQAETMDGVAGQSTQTPFVSAPMAGAARFSDFEGKDVYGAEGSKIGKINDILIGANGTVEAVVIGVGGFLGMGQKDVAVDMKALQLDSGLGAGRADAAVSGETTASTTDRGKAEGAVPQGENRGGATATMGGGNAGAARPGAPQEAAENTGKGALPDRLTLKVTRQQLQDAPAFERAADKAK